MRVRITEPAKADLVGIRAYIEGESPAAAREIARRLLDACSSLTDFPNRNRVGRAAGTRELTVRPYVIVYRVLSEEVQILRVWHGAQDRDSAAP